MVTQSW